MMHPHPWSACCVVKVEFGWELLFAALLWVLWEWRPWFPRAWWSELLWDGDVGDCEFGLTETLTGVGWVLNTGTCKSSKVRVSGIKIPFPIQINRNRSPPEQSGKPIRIISNKRCTVRQMLCENIWMKGMNSLLCDSRWNSGHVNLKICFELAFWPNRKKRSFHFTNCITWVAFHSHSKTILVGE